MKKIIKVCSTEEEILARIAKWHPDIEDFKLFKNDGACFALSFDNATEEDANELEMTFEDLSFSQLGNSLEEVLVELLDNNDLVLATAESLTGGNIGAKIVEVSGCSSVYYGGIISYSNEAKCKYLGVAEETIGDFGAVSEQTAIEMATGLLSERVKIGISTTGIAGPTGGSIRKPVGLVYIAITDEEHTNVYKEIFSGDRESIRNQARDKALFYAIKHLQRYY